MSYLAATLTQVTTMHTLVVNGVTFNDMREVSRWENFIKLSGEHKGHAVSAILMLEETGFGGAFAELFRSSMGEHDRPMLFISGSPAMLDAAGLVARAAGTTKPGPTARHNVDTQA